MRVAQIETNTYNVPLKKPWGDQTHQVTHIEVVVTDITADNGLVGTGFSYSVGVGGKAIQALIDWYIAPKLIGAEIAPRVQWHQLWKEAHDAGGGGISTMALSALDIALWDLVAKEQNRPLVQVLGQTRQAIPAYGSGVNLNLNLSELEDQIRRWLDQGYQAFKIKVGKPDLEEDLERLNMVRNLIGKRNLMVDANQGWDITSAVEAIKAYAPFNLYWIEEPLLSDDTQGHARLRRLVDAPIAIGENVYTKYQFNEYLASGACDFVQADVIRVGGVTPYLEIASMAQAWNVPMAPHFMLEITGQLLCCIPNARILEDVEGGSFRELGILANDVGVNNGLFVPPTEPGHGIIFNRDILAQYKLGETPPKTADRLWHAI
ncbi:mandelate racemase/muconate lactonizing enzyme family protein [Ammoniphilus resinae]|uniref:L-alanine-DL-glutamate epimerase-like enolase superfamily enzyme n=1 Tax=Ammoniphilus resinae TaxID=861532 RepID=A0ABS4GWQ1_9BACL|nr:mandelate racemase/muconate lactonizing enzyme family protein [Ammoniphilus resinae]MBP1934698.1 L-alanine-DL-glutamate epimerase-like enolase superfamily enzyme [Ammoniphilus resinae]